MKRREFLSKLGLVAVAVQAVGLRPSQAQEVVDETLGRSRVEGDQLRSRSLDAGLYPHHHDALIPLHFFQKPPVKGVRILTGPALEGTPFVHRHGLDLTQDHLIRIAKGEVVELDSDHGGHKFRLYIITATK